MTVLKQSIPCEDCEEWKEDLPSRDYVFIDCNRDPGQDGFCVVRYEKKKPAPAAAAAALLERTSRRASMEGLPAIAATQLQAPAAIATAAAPPAAGDVLPAGTQQRTAMAIVNLLESSEVLGNYAAVAVLPGDTGHLSYGRSQATLGSGSLHLMLQQYCQNPGARFGKPLAKWLDALHAQDIRLDNDLKLHNLLRACADDPVMRDVQDRFFDEHYWSFAVRAAAREGIRSPLGIAVVYDSHIQGSWVLIREKTKAALAGAAVDEQAWIRRYIQLRRDWLANNQNPLLRKTVYRMDTFQRLVDQDCWGLPLPLVVRDQEISMASLNAMPPNCYDGPQPGTRSLAIGSPLPRGLDVRLLQLALSQQGVAIKADGVFGATSAQHVKALQKQKNLPETGVADAAMVANLVSTLS